MRIRVIALLLSLSLVYGSSSSDPSGKGLDSELEPSNDFTFVRLVYSGGGWRGSNWATDYPKADIQFLYAVRKLTDFTFVNGEHKALPIMADNLFDYPFLYAVEVGNMTLSDEEASRLREYLLRGGFLVVVTRPVSGTAPIGEFAPDDISHLVTVVQETLLKVLLVQAGTIESGVETELDVIN